jgi:hypothetical protein
MPAGINNSHIDGKEDVTHRLSIAFIGHYAEMFSPFRILLPATTKQVDHSPDTGLIRANVLGNTSNSRPGVPATNPLPLSSISISLKLRASSFHQLSPGFLPASTSLQHVYLHTCKDVGCVGYNVLIRGGIRI